MTGFLLNGELEPTAAYAVREFAWVPTVEREGVLVIRQRRTPGGKEASDVYAVQEQSPPEAGVREFLLVNTTDAEQPDCYRVQVGPLGDTCTCKAAKCRLGCKHRDTARHILSTGV